MSAHKVNLELSCVVRCRRLREMLDELMRSPLAHSETIVSTYVSRLLE